LLGAKDAFGVKVKFATGTGVTAFGELVPTIGATGLPVTFDKGEVVGLIVPFIDGAGAFETTGTSVASEFVEATVRL
jgi:hypothetical protein